MQKTESQKKKDELLRKLQIGFSAAAVAGGYGVVATELISKGISADIALPLLIANSALGPLMKSLSRKKEKAEVKPGSIEDILRHNRERKEAMPGSIESILRHNKEKQKS